MRLLIHDYAGHPFQVQLSRALAARGHEVTHAYASSIQTPRGALTRRDDDPAGFQIAGIGLSEPFQKHSFVKRRFQEVEYGRLIADKAEELAPDWVVSGNTPTEAQSILLDRCKKAGVPFAYWVQDFYGIAVHKLLSKKIPVVGAAVGGYYKWLDRKALRASDRVIVITDDFVPLMNDMSIGGDQLEVIENWAPLEEMPVRDRDNAWSEEHDLSDKFCYLYSGTLGMKHNPQLLLDLAVAYRDDPAVRVVVVSEGIGIDWLEQQRDDLGLDNLVLLPFQPFERLPDVLGSADVLIAILEPDAGVFSVPSKVLTYLCAGRALLTAIPASNLAARIVERCKAGLVVAPEDHAAFLEAARTLHDNRELREACGRCAREYSEQTFDIDRITDRFDALLAEQSAPAAAPAP